VSSLHSGDSLPLWNELINKLRNEDLHLKNSSHLNTALATVKSTTICGNIVDNRVCRGTHPSNSCWKKYPELAPTCSICNGRHLTKSHDRFTNKQASHYSVCFPLSQNWFSFPAANS
jgi:hypothetical protein